MNFLRGAFGGAEKLAEGHVLGHRRSSSSHSEDFEAPTVIKGLYDITFTSNDKVSTINPLTHQPADLFEDINLALGIR